MDTLLCFLGSLLLLSLAVSGLLFIVAPPVGRHLLQKTAAITVGMVIVLCALSIVWNAVRGISSIALLLAATVISTIAYFIREYRLHGHARRETPRHNERTPVMPHHLRGGDQ